MKKAYILLFACLVGTVLAAQSRKELEDKRKQLIEEINQTTSHLEETQKNKAATLERYLALQNQIRKRQQLITTLRKEIDFADHSIDRANEILEALNFDIERLKKEYAIMLRTAYRHKLSRSFLVFLFSADNFNDAFKRWQYILQYDRYRKEQVHLIAATQKTLIDKSRHLEERRKEKEQLLGSQEEQQQLLSKELSTKNELIKNLKADESRLSTELNAYQEAHDKLNSAIENTIKDEMARKRKEARTPGALAANAKEEPSETTRLSADFVRNKGRLPWPVEGGSIARRFGTQEHPTLKGIEITNNGIDIRTESAATVFSIFGGTVVGAQFVPGYKNTIIVQHGEYYTVYSNLEETFVSRGDEVAVKTQLGKISDDKPELHFEVWREKQRLNPVHWVNKK